jgi:hypothetical protein
MDWAVVHACKMPCHQVAVGYTKEITATSPRYLVYERGADLFLNLVDAPLPLFQMATFHAVLAFCAKPRGGQLLFHCNEGRSRAPSLALLHLAKNAHRVNATTYAAACQDFLKLYPAYAPGKGIAQYLATHWEACIEGTV